MDPPPGVGIHTGVAYVGAVGAKGGRVDITVLGDAANIAAHLCASAKPGEIPISEAAYAAAGLESSHLERQQLELKGKTGYVAAYALRDYSSDL